jgi:hypothetical protein
MTIRMVVRPYQAQDHGLANAAVTAGLGGRRTGKMVLQLCAFIASLSAVALCVSVFVSVFANNLTSLALRGTSLLKFSPSEDRDTRPLATARGRISQNSFATSASKVIKSSLYRSHEKSRVARRQDPRTGEILPLLFLTISQHGLKSSLRCFEYLFEAGCNRVSLKFFCWLQRCLILWCRHYFGSMRRYRLT